MDSTPMEIEECDGGKMIKVKLKNDEVVEASLDELKMFEFISEMMQTLKECDLPDISFERIQLKTFKKILQWTNKYKNTPQLTLEELKKQKDDDIDLWKKEFLAMPISDLCELISACNYLNLQELLWLSTREIANMMTGKDQYEIREIFGLEHDFQPDDFQ